MPSMDVFPCTVSNKPYIKSFVEDFNILLIGLIKKEMQCKWRLIRNVAIFRPQRFRRQSRDTFLFKKRCPR